MTTARMTRIERRLIEAEYLVDSTNTHVRRAKCDDVKPLALQRYSKALNAIRSAIALVRNESGVRHPTLFAGKAGKGDAKVDRLWVCSGVFKDPGGVHLDINRDVKPDVRGDAQQLPFRDESFDFVFADPPYSEEESRRFYNLPNPSAHAIVKEAFRVCRQNGHVLLLHRLVPLNDQAVPQGRTYVAIVGIAVLAHWSNIRALTVLRKPGSIDPAFWDGRSP